MRKIIIPAAVAFGLALTTAVQAVEIDKSVASHPVIEQVFAKYEKAFNAGDVKALGALWISDGEFVDSLGEKIVGREAVEKLFQEFFARTKGEKLNLKVLSLKEEEDGKVVVAEVVPELSPPMPGSISSNKAQIVLVLSGKNWLIEGVKESPLAPVSFEHLKDLEWLVGTWTNQTGQTPAKADSDAASQVYFNSTFQWTANKSFLTRTFTTRTKLFNLHGTEIIGWDPQAKSIRSWQFDSTGGFTESVWKVDGKQWIVDTHGVLADGEAVSSVSKFTKIDENTLSVQSQKRTRGGKTQPDISPITVHRAAAPAQEGK